MSKEDGKQHLAEQALAGPPQSHSGARRKISRRGQEGTSSSSSEGAEPQQEFQPMEEGGDPAPAWKGSEDLSTCLEGPGQQQGICPMEEGGDPGPASKGHKAPCESHIRNVHWRKMVLGRLRCSRPSHHVCDARVWQDLGKQQRASVTRGRNGQGKKGPRPQESLRKQHGNQKCEKEDGSATVLCHPSKQQAGASNTEQTSMSKEVGKQHWAEQAMAGPPQSHLGARGKVSRRGQQGSSSFRFEGVEQQQEIDPTEERGDPVPASKGHKAPRETHIRNVHWRKMTLGRLRRSSPSHHVRDARVKQDLGKQQQTSVTRVKDREGNKLPCLQESPMRQHGKQNCEKEDGSTPVLCHLLSEQQEQTGESDRKILEGDLRSYTGEEPGQSSAPEQSTQLGKSPAESPEEGGKGNSHKCLYCGKRFRWSSLLICHQRVHTGEKPYQCNVCGRSFKRNSELVRHKYLHSGEKPHKCDKCGKSFKRGEQLALHQRIHSGERPFQCKECGRGFAQSLGLARHQQIHSGERPFQCNICGKIFRHISSCRRHQFLHLQDKLFKCEECGKSFAQHQGLAQHQQIHTGERPFQCKECGRAFAQRSSLAQHQRIHSGKKPYQCNVCGKSFRQSGHLRGHQTVHSREKVSKCEECGKTFALNVGVAQDIHTSKKPTRCEECGKSFSHKSDPGQHPPVDPGEKLHKSE